jgi:hypothetical protein
MQCNAMQCNAMRIAVVRRHSGCADNGNAMQRDATHSEAVEVHSLCTARSLPAVRRSDHATSRHATPIHAKPSQSGSLGTGGDERRFGEPEELAARQLAHPAGQLLKAACSIAWSVCACTCVCVCARACVCMSVCGILQVASCICTMLLRGCCKSAWCIIHGSFCTVHPLNSVWRMLHRECIVLYVALLHVACSTTVDASAVQVLIDIVISSRVPGRPIASLLYSVALRFKANGFESIACAYYSTHPGRSVLLAFSARLGTLVGQADRLLLAPPRY